MTTTDELKNWAGNYRYGAGALHYPKTLEEVQKLVARSRKLKALGTRHAFNGIADTSGDLLSLAQFESEMRLDRDRGTVTVGGGVRYGELCEFLEREGYALHNLASLPHISVAGACATATHGSGDGNGNLASAVSAIELVTAEGDIVAFARGADCPQFPGAVVGLGALGVVTSLTLDIVPGFAMRQDVYESLPMAVLEHHFEELFSSAYSVSLFTDWRSSHFTQVWLKRRVVEDLAIEPPPGWFDAAPAPVNRHPLAGRSAESCTEQMGIAGRWHERLPHFQMNYVPSSGDELQSEYLVPRQHAWEALRALDGIREWIAPLLQISEVRTIAADTLWMSPCCGQACVAFHFTWKSSWHGVQKLLPIVEQHLAPYDARPHWGKLFAVPSVRLHALYPRLPDFQKLIRTYDPRGKFHNAFLDRSVLDRL